MVSHAPVQKCGTCSAATTIPRFPCVGCYMSFKTEYAVLSHMRALGHGQSLTSLPQLSHCGKSQRTFKTTKALEQHNSVVHPPVRAKVSNTKILPNITATKLAENKLTTVPKEAEKKVKPPTKSLLDDYCAECDLEFPSVLELEAVSHSTSLYTINSYSQCYFATAAYCWSDD